MLGIGHVPGDEDEECREPRHRQVGEERRERENRGQDEDRVHDRGDRRAGAGADPGRRARDRAGGGDPTKNGAVMFPTPCAMSSASESCLRPVMPSATAADSNDSMAPSIAIANAEGTSAQASQVDAERVAVGPCMAPGPGGERG